MKRCLFFSFFLFSFFLHILPVSHNVTERFHQVDSLATVTMWIHLLQIIYWPVPKLSKNLAKNKPFFTHPDLGSGIWFFCHAHPISKFPTPHPVRTRPIQLQRKKTEAPSDILLGLQFVRDECWAKHFVQGFSQGGDHGQDWKWKRQRETSGRVFIKSSARPTKGLGGGKGQLSPFRACHFHQRHFVNGFGDILHTCDTHLYKA